MAFGTTISFKLEADSKPYFTIGETDTVKTVREEKGKSLVQFPRAYTVIDIETTGLSPEWDEIIELSAIKYADGVEVDEFTTLVHPENEVDEYITELTGITNEMLLDAPPISECIEEYSTFIGNDLIVGYNVNFDINFIYDNMQRVLEKSFSNDFVDVMRIARKELPELKHHRQTDIAEYFGIEINRAHRALDDCRTCNDCFLFLQNHIIARGITLEEFCQSYKGRNKGLHAKDIKAALDEFDTENPLYGKVCVFTGTLEKMSRAEAMQLVANVGGTPADGITKKTNFLILGNNDYCKTIKDGKSSKQKKAEALILGGADLQIVPEQVFYDMLTES